MSDDRHPDEIRDEIPDAAFAGLGLDSLGDGVHATAAQWSTIATAASRRRQRRTWVIAAAAMLVLVAGTAAVLVDRRGDDATVDIAMGGGTGELYVLPPEGSTDVTAERVPEGSVIHYTDPKGQPWVLRQGLPMSMFDDRGDLGSIGEVGLVGPGSVDVPPFGEARLSCGGSVATAASSDGTATTASGPATAFFRVGPMAAYLTPSYGTDGPCRLDDPVFDAVAALRLVDREVFDEFMGGLPTSIPDPDPSDEAIVAGGTPSTLPHDVPSTTTSTQVPPNVDPAARGQIIEAFEKMDERDADGGLPYVEGEDADLLARMKAAGERAGITAPTTFAVVDIDFLTPTSASVAFRSTASLASGPITNNHVGAAVVVDGRWQVTRETVEALVAIAGP